MTKLLAVAGLSAAMILSAPAVRAQDDAAFSDPTVAMGAAVAPAQTIAPADVLKLMQDRDAKIALVDTQPVDGYAEGHIPGAINYPWVMRIKSFPISLPRNKTLIFYGSCPNDTTDIVKQLAQFGYFDVKIMDGGWYKWLELKYPAAGTNPAAPAAGPAPAEVSQLAAAPAKSGKAITSAK
ncbi:MAG TPA: rhodanese-like domain-containing protein [Candidatus Acidoferrales bacterium]|nr:rhodanese-like domain-containing protein [Candidatus Acidoferrales bacterium]